MARLLAMNASASEAGKACTAALIAFSQDNLHGKVFDGAAEMFLRRLMGAEYADMLGVTPQNGCLAAVLPTAMFKMFRLGEQLEDRWPSLAQATDALGNAIIVGLRHGYRSYKGRGLELPPEKPGRSTKSCAGSEVKNRPFLTVSDKAQLQFRMLGASVDVKDDAVALVQRSAAHHPRRKATLQFRLAG